MKDFSDLQKALQDEEYFNSQFEQFGSDKNILFVSPQLTGKQLYKSILPYFCMHSNEVLVAMTGLHKYDPKAQLTDIEMPLNSKQIMWADFIVIPFTAQPLTSGDNDIYAAIRNLNEQCKIVYSMDFNIYELSELHPYKSMFTPETIQAVEDNIWNSDILLVSNMALRDYMLSKLKKYYEDKDPRFLQPPKCDMACMPFIMNTEMVLKNIDFDPQQPIKVDKVEHTPEIEVRISEVMDASRRAKEILPPKEAGQSAAKKAAKSKATPKEKPKEKPKAKPKAKAGAKNQSKSK